MTRLSSTSAGDPVRSAPVATRNVFIILALAAAVLIVYGQTATFSFVNYDDPGYVSENGVVNDGLSWTNVKWAFTSIYQTNWQPLVWLSYMLDVSLFHAYHPGAHHVVNVGMHLASTIILFLVLARMTRRVWPSAFVAALFAVHPLHVESVAWIAERKDVLSVLFWMLTMAAYVAYVERPGIGRYLLVFVLLALGLMAKPMLVTLPFVLLLMDYWPLKRFGWPISVVAGTGGPRSVVAQTSGRDGARPSTARRVFPWQVFVEKVPLLTLSAVSSYITFTVQRDAGAMSFGLTLTHGQRISSAIMACATYVFKTVWPTHLAAIYPYIQNWPLPQVLMAAGGLGLATVAAVLLVRRMPYLAVGWLWFLGTLVPVIGIVQVGWQSMADRYTYIPLTGIFIAAAFLAADLGSKRRGIAVGSGILGAAAVVALVVVAFIQVTHWKDSEALFRQAVTIKGNYVAENNLAAGLLVKPSAPRDVLMDALQHARNAVVLKPDYADAHCNIGLALANLGDMDGAIAAYREAIRYQPGHRYAQGNLAAAADQCEKAAAANPSNPGARISYALCMAALGRSSKAADQFRAAVSLQPDNVQALDGLAWILATDPDPAVRNAPEAVERAERAVRLTRRADAGSLDILAAAYAEAGRMSEAILVAQEAEKEAAGDASALQAIRQRLDLYRAGRPFRTEPAP
jgi:protein O-mannosyl-transferase